MKFLFPVYFVSKLHKLQYISDFNMLCLYYTIFAVLMFNQYMHLVS